MKGRIIIIFILLLTISCKKLTPSRTISRVEIQEFTINETSIRALSAINENNVVYAGSNGKIGFYDINEGLSELNIAYQDSIIPHFRSLAFNGKDFYALSIGNPALLYKIKNRKYEIVYKEEHEKVFYDSMHFFDNGRNGIAVGDPTEDCPSIVITNDGGNTWKKVSCNDLPKFVTGEAFFAASNTNIKILDDTVWIVSGGKKARVLKSEDKGKTWQVSPTPIVQGNGPQGIYSVDFYDQNNGIIIGGDYSKPNDNCKNKAITTNGGKDWTIVANNMNPNYKSCVQYVPEGNGNEIFTVGKTGISYSTDRGNTWKHLPNLDFYAIQFVNKNTAWLTGKNKIGRLTIY
ncbi:WD40/YVTN/BNR-like repeat-containing protein [Tenacibaculum agarivorans]|uniref:WD40/YVTN/BNR-like repeat-containing protein n=1 Tax=Tenacibaculum agarivorans TaxID=1908389 RepID=UPI00094B7FF3|nr:oxidoreductase [Tenacibaculum agarivorans]